MKRWALRFDGSFFFSACCQRSVKISAYLGFDRNAYPGDANLKALHQTFSYTGYWLNNPPGEHNEHLDRPPRRRRIRRIRISRALQRTPLRRN